MNPTSSTISTTEAARHLGDVLARIKHTGESVLLTKSNLPIARLVPATPPARANGAEIMKNLSELPHDPGFAGDLEQVNRSDKPLRNPWD